MEAGPELNEGEQEAAAQGGETSCYAHLLCEECGAVLDGSGHRDECSRARNSPR